MHGHNCLLSELAQRDLRPDLDFKHDADGPSGESWRLMAWDWADPRCREPPTGRPGPPGPPGGHFSGGPPSHQGGSYGGPPPPSGGNSISHWEPPRKYFIFKHTSIFNLLLSKLTESTY